MMGNKKKQTVIVLALFCLLAAIAAAPLFLLDYNSASLLGTYHTQMLAQSYTIEEPQATTLDAFERLRLIHASIEEGSNGIVTFSAALPWEQEQALVHSVEEQLSYLHALGALPPLNYDGTFKLISSKHAYRRMQTSFEPIIVWHLQIAYSNLFIDVYMDAETLLLYDISILFDRPNQEAPDGFVYDAAVLMSEGFFEYLQEGSAEGDAGYFAANGSYSANAIRLYAESYDEETGEMVAYRFDEGVDR